MLIRLAAFLSSFLLFLVQPLVARMVLPALGGSAQVWNACVCFFQTCLLGGYLYAHLSTRLLPPRLQLGVHLVLGAVGLGLLPLSRLILDSPPLGSSPVPWLLGKLLLALGAPFVVLAASSSLLQRWLSLRGGPDGEDPYFLYAASNSGALLALVVYPLLLDPFLVQDRQVALWRLGGYGFLFLLAALVWQFGRGSGFSASSRGSSESIPSSWGQVFVWLGLSFVPASLMLAVTAHMTNEVPSVPLLWVTPLFLYLLSFTLVFARQCFIPPGVFTALQPPLLAVLSIVLFVPTRILGFSLHLLVFFVTAMILHRELARRRPGPEGLTRFYLWLALGGALGGIFQSLLAPWIFPFVAEYPLLLVLAAGLRPVPETDRKEEGPWPRRLDLLAPALLAVFTLGVLAALPRVGDERDVVAPVAILFFSAAVAWSLRRRPRRFSLALAAVLAGGFLAFRLPGTLVFRRSPYGVHRVAESPDHRLHQLFHGSTLHGVQDRSRPGVPPVAYFYPGSPVGELLEKKVPARGRLAVIGLGVGSVAWYLKPGQRLVYFELDPVVEELARDPRFFTHLAEARGAVEVRLGDGRLELAREPESSFDLVFADAFSSDAVPVHLLTREALEGYLRKLRPGGALLFNTSNRHLRLESLLAVLARDLGLVARASRPPPLTLEQERAGLARASFVLMVRNQEDLATWAGESWKELGSGDGPVWRDDYCSVLPYLRW